MRALCHGPKLAGWKRSSNGMQAFRARELRLCVLEATLRKNLTGQFSEFLAGPLPYIYLWYLVRKGSRPGEAIWSLPLQSPPSEPRGNFRNPLDSIF